MCVKKAFKWLYLLHRDFLIGDYLQFPVHYIESFFNFSKVFIFFRQKRVKNKKYQNIVLSFFQQVLKCSEEFLQLLLLRRTTSDLCFRVCFFNSFVYPIQKKSQFLEIVTYKTSLLSQLKNAYCVPSQRFAFRFERKRLLFFKIAIFMISRGSASKKFNLFRLVSVIFQILL